MPDDMEVLDLTVNNRAGPNILLNRPSFNPAPHFRNIRDDVTATRDNSDNNSIDSINHKSVASYSSHNYKKTNEIVRILPEFNGKNTSVNRFIRECRDAENFVNPSDRNFF